MANQAAKKAKKSATELSRKLQQWILPINILYLVYRLVWLYVSVTRWTLVGYALLTGVTYLTYTWIIGAAEEGGTSEYAMDVLIITLFVQAGLIISDYFWYFYLIIPGYVLFLGGRMIKSYVFTPTSAEKAEDENDPAMIKRKEKAERRAAKPKFRMSR